MVVSYIKINNETSRGKLHNLQIRLSHSPDRKMIVIPWEAPGNQRVKFRIGYGAEKKAGSESAGLHSLIGRPLMKHHPVLRPGSDDISHKSPLKP